MGNYLYAIIPYEEEIHVDSIDAEYGYCFDRSPDIPQLNGYVPSLLDIGYGTFTLFPGFLLINTCFRMYILEDSECETNPLRKDIYEIAKALGATEAWYYSEYSIDEIYEDKSISYNKLLEKFATVWKDHVLEYEKGMKVSSFVHDSFSDFING